MKGCFLRVALYGGVLLAAATTFAQAGLPVSLFCEPEAGAFCTRLAAELEAMQIQVERPAGAEAAVEVRQASREVVVTVRHDGVLETRTYSTDEAEPASSMILAIRVAEGLRAVYSQHSHPVAARLEDAAALEASPAVAQAMPATFAAFEAQAPGGTVAAVSFHDAATVGKGRLVVSAATRLGGGFAGYTGIDGPALGQTVDLAFGVKDWLQLGIGGAVASAGEGCVEASPRAYTGNICFRKLYYGAALKLGGRLYRSASDRFQLGLELAGGVYYQPYEDGNCGARWLAPSPPAASSGTTA
jgi:hypothetical protein